MKKYADGTLKSMRKNELIELIRCLEKEIKEEKYKGLENARLVKEKTSVVKLNKHVMHNTGKCRCGRLVRTYQNYCDECGSILVFY